MTSLRDRLQTSLGGAYTVEDELGGGGMSRVFVATESALHRQVVLKVLPPDLAAGASTERFRHEIQLAASLQHPHIVPIHAAGEADGLLYYTMPFVTGESLRTRLNREGELPIADAIRILRDVADALGHAHARGVVHRDIKPDNVLLSNNHAVVTDFGVAKAVSAAQTGERLTDVGLALGTPGYMAPEQGSADPHVDHRADIYSFGAMAYEMLAGQAPFNAPTARALIAAHISETPRPIREKRPAVPPMLGDLVMRCLEKRPADRPQSATEVARLLDSLIISGAGTLTPQPLAPVRRRVPRAAIAAVAAVLVVGVGLAVALMGSRRDPTVDQSVVVVLPFRTAAADPSLQYLREGMLDLISAKLAGTVRATDPRTALRAWREAGGSQSTDLTEAEAARVARSLGAGRALHGDIIGSGSSVVITATLIRSTGTGSARARVEGAAASLALLVDSLVSKLFAQEAGPDEEQVRLLAGTPLTALQQYLAGEAAYRGGHYAEAADLYARALDEDSTFALAGLRLHQAAAWIGFHPRRAEAIRIAFDHGEKLAPRHRAVLEAIASRDRPPTCAEQRERQERSLATITDLPELWYAYGDNLYHCGDVMGVPNAARRSLEAFNRSLALDSAFAPALEHLPMLHRQFGDTAAAMRTYAIMKERGSDYAPITGVVLSEDPGERERLMLEILRGPPWRARIATGMLAFEGRVGDAERIMTELRRRAVTEADRAGVLGRARDFAVARGRLAEALRISREANDPAYVYVGDALFFKGDSAAAADALPEVRRVPSRPLPAKADPDWWRSVYVAAAYDLAQGNTETARRAAALLRSARFPPDANRSEQVPTALALLLELQIASAEKRGDTRPLLERLDSLVRQGSAGDLEFAAWRPLSREWERLGDVRRAYAAASRMRLGFGPPPVEQIRERARLAALAGDRDAAISWYRRYLGFRSDPDPQLRPQRDSVRAELARLQRGRS